MLLLSFGRIANANLAKFLLLELIVKKALVVYTAILLKKGQRVFNIDCMYDSYSLYLLCNIIMTQ